MQRISLSTTASVETKNYWKTYITCVVLLAPFVVISAVTSVQNMYSNTSSQEFEFKKRELTENVRILEQQRAEASNLRTLHASAVQNGYTNISNLQYVEMPANQGLALR